MFSSIKMEEYMESEYSCFSWVKMDAKNIVLRSTGTHFMHMRVKCNLWNNDKKCKTCGIIHKYSNCFLGYTNFNDDLAEYKCQHKFDKKLKERFFNTYKFLNHDNHKFIWLLWKGIYPYEHMDD